MTWFKVDDGLYDHPKMFDAPDCAVALWTRAGSWAARNLTDGFVPAGMPRRLCDDPERAVEELLARGLWERAEGGFMVHDFLVYNRSKDQVLEERRKDAEKKATARAALAEKRRKGRSTRPGGTPAGTPRRSPSGSPGLPDPGSLPSSGNPASGGRGAERPPARDPVAARAAAARGMSSLRPILASLPAGKAAAPSGRRPSARRGDAQRAEQDRLAELDAVQVGPAVTSQRSPPSLGTADRGPDQREEGTA